ncbi:lipocalin family protein [Deferrisoma sp.]
MDLERYAGTWYEIASYPNRFQKGCTATRATYTLWPDGKIRVRNECRRGSLEGDWDSVTGRAWVPDPASPAKLKVSFFWPFRGDYWILHVGEGYRTAVVGSPSREYLWILSRTPHLEESEYQDLVRIAAERGFDPARLVRTPQP